MERTKRRRQGSIELPVETIQKLKNKIKIYIFNIVVKMIYRRELKKDKILSETVVSRKKSNSCYHIIDKSHISLVRPSLYIKSCS